MNTAVAISTVVVAVLATLGAITRVVGRVVKGITTLIAETKNNTTAVKDVGDKLDNNVSSIHTTLTDHEGRITKLEAKP